MNKIDTHTFTAALRSEGSWGASALGTHESSMDLWLDEDRTKGFIEWDIPALETTEEIGLWFEKGRAGRMYLTDYDGVMSLPKEAIALLRKNGIQVGREYE